MKLTGIFAAVVAALFVTVTSVAAQMGTRFGAPTEGMSTQEYQALVFLDPQNTVRMDWHAVKDMDGNFLIDNQGEPTVSVVDYDKGETVKMIDMGETGNHHIWVIPGARYVWSSQRYEKDVFWTIDLTTQEVVDKFSVSMDGKKVIAPLHIGFAYTKPLAVTGNILDKENGYLTFLNTATRRPFATVTLSCPGARDAMFTLDDSKVFTTCQQKPMGVSIVDVKSRKEIKMYPIKGGRAGAMSPDGKYFMASAKGSVVFFDTNTIEIVKRVEVPGGGGNITCLADSSKCYVGLRKANKIGVIDMAKLELITTIDTGKDANRLYLNPANPRYGLVANESGKSDEITVIDTKEDVALKQVETGLGPHNVAFNPQGTRAIVSTKKEPTATLVDTSDADPMKWETITTDIEAGIQNNGVRWVPSPAALQAKLAK
ncbi:MAG: YncE family protein [Gammaproteobacteria bacterium]|nr:YncE family protein [Gammaproteobacteria bacterium]MDX2460883.1 YncE family protein [Gammaproteobacteria bacterium]